jgi:hypothetical protein
MCLPYFNRNHHIIVIEFAKQIKVLRIADKVVFGKVAFQEIAQRRAGKKLSSPLHQFFRPLKNIDQQHLGAQHCFVQVYLPVHQPACYYEFFY